MNIAGKIQSLKDIKQTIKSEAGNLGQKLNIKPPETSTSKTKEVKRFYFFYVEFLVRY